MRRIAAAALMLFASCLPVAAGLSRAGLDAVRIDVKPDAALPLDTRLIDEHGAPTTLRVALGGRPAVLVFADYTCTNLCGPILAFAAAGLAQSGLRPGSDYRLIVVAIDPKDSPEAARAFKANHLDPDTPLAAATTLLSGDAAAVAAITAAAGYGYAYDPQHDQFAHPASAFVLTASGHVARVLSGLGLTGGDLRLALVDAGNGRIGTLADRIHLLCYGFDPVRGIYSASIARMLAAAAFVTVMLLAGGIGFLAYSNHGHGQA